MPVSLAPGVASGGGAAGFPKAAAPPMLGPMPILPRPVSPKSAFTDLKEMLTGDRPHKWPLLVLSVALTVIIIWAFAHDARGPKREREIIYVESWMADRRDSDILIQQKKDVATYEAALERKQREFQSVADKFGIEWRQDEARNKARRLEVIAAVNRQLDAKIAAARAREAAGQQPHP